MVLEQRDIHGARPAEPADKVDWDAVYADQLPRIYSYFRFRLGREADVEDLTARTFEKPSYATIADASYPLARPIYLYVDQARIVRSRDAYDAMESLKSLGFYRSVDTSFVELDERAARKQRSRPMRKLSESDLNNQ